MRKTYMVRVQSGLGKLLEQEALKREIPYQVFARMLLKKALMEESSCNKASAKPATHEQS